MTTLLSENDFSKTFLIDEVRLYVCKAYDKESAIHYLVVSIPEIPKLKVQKVQYPVDYRSISERDFAFLHFDANGFFDEVSEHIEKNKATYSNSKN